MLTKNLENAGTNSRIVLIINQNGVDTIDHTFSDTSQKDQERGQANLYGVYVGDDLVFRENIGDGSVRIGIRGGDAWRPEHFFVWGTGEEDGIVYPIGAEVDMNTKLSTDANEGSLSFPVRRVAVGSDDMEISRLVIFVKTYDIGNAGTDSTINLQMSSSGSIIVNFDFPDTPQQDQERGQANLYFAPIGTPFRKRDLDDRSIVLSIKGTDLWTPERLMIFGLDQPSGRPTAMVALVHRFFQPSFHLSTDPAEGRQSVILALEPSPPQISSLSARIERLERLLR